MTDDTHFTYNKSGRKARIGQYIRFYSGNTKLFSIYIVTAVEEQTSLERATIELVEGAAVTVSSNLRIEAGSNLSGYDGEVMVYIPSFWIRSWEYSTYNEVRISPQYIDESWEYQPSLWLSAYDCTILREVPENMGYLSTLPVNSAVSICNTATYCRGGNNSTTYDDSTDPFKSNLGKPATNIARSTMRTYMRNGRKEILSYKQYKNILYWLYVIEYANFNS